jgi:predicted DNA repair protein MutK
MPSLVTVLLMLGGAYLCFEGVEKLLHGFTHSADKQQSEEQIHKALQDPKTDFKALEQEKIRGAIRTDFILSAEIIVISLGAVAGADFPVRVGALCAIAVIMTVGVYGLVAAIVRLDDLGLTLVKRDGGFSQSMGRAILSFAPILMRVLSVAGTAAMFLVGGGIINHGLPVLEHASTSLIASMAQPWSTLTQMLWSGVLGAVVGMVLLALYSVVKRVAGNRTVG